MIINLETIEYDKLNEYYGIYEDKNNKEKILIVVSENPNELVCYNLFASYKVILNLSTNKGSYYNIIKKDNNPLNIKKIKEYETKLIKSDIKFEMRDGVILLIIYSKLEWIQLGKNDNIKLLLVNNQTQRLTKGGTREVILLDKVVLKYTDPTCNLLCEQLTNYFAVLNEVNVCKFLGIVRINGIPLICEKKDNYINWLDVIKNEQKLIEYKQKWDIFIKPLIINDIAGDYNLGNMLEDDNGKLVVTDFNGNYKVYSYGTIITAIETATNFALRLLDYVFDPRISKNILTIQYTILPVLMNYINTITKKDESKLKNKYLKYKQKYLNLK